MWEVCASCVLLIEECGSRVSYAFVALKMAVGGHGRQVAVSLLNRLHGAKDWVVCVAMCLVMNGMNQSVCINCCRLR